LLRGALYFVHWSADATKRMSPAQFVPL
jgi:hypothetical protein